MRKTKDHALSNTTNTSTKTLTNISHFGSLTSEEELSIAAKPNNTICNTRWAEKNLLLNVTNCLLKTLCHWIYSRFMMQNWLRICIAS